MSEFASNGRPVAPRAVLIVGVHREELAFGDRVAEGLDTARIDLLRIPQGLPARRPSQEEAFYYSTNHRELYLQILSQVRGRYDLAIDLHCGVNEPGRCADLFSADPQLLQCACAAADRPRVVCAGPVRPILLSDPEEHERAPVAPNLLRAHTVIPKAIWDNPELTYLGLEIFMPVYGEGEPEDWALAQQLIGTLLDCAMAPESG